MPDVLAGRTAVGEYRQAHKLLGAGGWYKKLPEDHTPLQNILLDKLLALGFNSEHEFFIASDDFKAKALGYINKPDFEKRLTEVSKEEVAVLYKAYREEWE